MTLLRLALAIVAFVWLTDARAEDRCNDPIIPKPGEWNLYKITNGFIHQKDEESYASRNECERVGSDLAWCGKIRSYFCAIGDHSPSPESAESAN